MDWKYQSLANELRRKIEDRRYPDGRLPTEQTLCRDFQVSRQTVRQALALLAREGVVEKRQGSGTYISPSFLKPGTVSKKIALLLPFSGSSFVPEEVWRISPLLSEAGYLSRIFYTENHFGRERQLLSLLSDDPVRGILTAPPRAACPTPNLDLYRKLMDQGTSIVFLGEPCPGLPGLPAVRFDEYAGGYQLTERLLSLGHTRIGGIFRWDDGSGQKRFQGCLCCLRDHGVDFDDRRFLWQEGPQAPIPSGPNPLRSFLQTRLPDCSAVICQEEETARLLIRELALLDIRVPDQILLASFGTGLPEAPSSLPVLTAFPAERNPWALAAQGLLQTICGHPFSPEPIGWSIP